MLIQTYKRLVSRRGPEQSVMRAYWGPVEVQMTHSWCSARLSGPRVGPLNIFSCSREVIWVCLFVCLWISILVPCHEYTYSGVEHSCLPGQVSLESERTYHSACVRCVFVMPKSVHMTFFPIPAPSLSFFFPPPRCVWMPRALTGIFTHNEVTPYHPPPPAVSSISPPVIERKMAGSPHHAATELEEMCLLAPVQCGSGRIKTGFQEFELSFFLRNRHQFLPQLLLHLTRLTHCHNKGI